MGQIPVIPDNKELEGIINKNMCSSGGVEIQTSPATPQTQGIIKNYIIIK